MRFEGGDMSEISALYFLAYSNSGGGLMRLLLATPNAGIFEFNCIETLIMIIFYTMMICRSARTSS